MVLLIFVEKRSDIWKRDENQADLSANEAFSKSALLLEMSIHDHAQQPKVQGSKFSTES